MTSADVRHDAQFKHHNLIEIYAVVLNFTGRAWRAKVVLLSHDFPITLPSLRCPAQYKLLRTCLLLLKEEENMFEPLRLIEPDTDGLLTRFYRSPA